ncbi:MAG: hypothetical protein IKM28_05750 [Lachnospiraceae bacterium]|nr:hypothetical protein [Lachnospiraceae bacterium]
MKEFVINIPRTYAVVHKEKQMLTKLWSIHENVYAIRSHLAIDSKYSVVIEQELSQVIQQLSEEKDSIQKMSEALRQFIEYYNETEERIIDYSEGSSNNKLSSIWAMPIVPVISPLIVEPNLSILDTVINQRIINWPKIFDRIPSIREILEALKLITPRTAPQLPSFWPAIQEAINSLTPPHTAPRGPSFSDLIPYIEEAIKKSPPHTAPQLPPTSFWANPLFDSINDKIGFVIPSMGGIVAIGMAVLTIEQTVPCSVPSIMQSGKLIEAIKKISHVFPTNKEDPFPQLDDWAKKLGDMPKGLIPMEFKITPMKPMAPEDIFKMKKVLEFNRRPTGLIPMVEPLGEKMKDIFSLFNPVPVPKPVSPIFDKIFTKLDDILVSITGNTGVKY